MKCPYCSSLQTSVIDSRDSENNTAIRRRRLCDNCSRRFTTYERVEGLDLKVVKKDNSKENFNREKLKKGLIKATWKRPVRLDDIDQLVDQIEQEIRLKESSEIKSWEIGNLAITGLKKLDKLSYLLFASVYRDFNSLDDFDQEIQKLKSK